MGKIIDIFCKNKIKKLVINFQQLKNQIGFFTQLKKL